MQCLASNDENILEKVISHIEWYDPQLQAGGNYSDLTKWRSTIFKSCWLISRFIFYIFKRWYVMC